VIAFPVAVDGNAGAMAAELKAVPRGLSRCCPSPATASSLTNKIVEFSVPPWQRRATSLAAPFLVCSTNPALRRLTTTRSEHRAKSVVTIRSTGNFGRVEMWRGFCRSDISVSVPFVWRCLSGPTVAPFPHPAHRTGRADFPHPALGQDLTPLFWRATPSAGPEPFLEFIGRPISQVLHHVLRLS
jgi:hypothetical protein